MHTDAIVKALQDLSINSIKNIKGTPNLEAIPRLQALLAPPPVSPLPQLPIYEESAIHPRVPIAPDPGVGIVSPPRVDFVPTNNELIVESSPASIYVPPEVTPMSAMPD